MNLSEVIDLELRQELVDAVLNRDVMAAVNDSFREKRLMRTPYIPPPKLLWGSIPVLGGEGATYLNGGSPGLMLVDLTLLKLEKLIMFRGYVLSFTSYVKSEYLAVKRMSRVLMMHVSELKDRLLFAYKEGVPQSRRLRLVRIDPQVIQLQFDIEVLKAEAEGYSATVKDLEELGALCKLEVTRKLQFL